MIRSAPICQIRMIRGRWDLSTPHFLAPPIEDGCPRRRTMDSCQAGSPCCENGLLQYAVTEGGEQLDRCADIRLLAFAVMGNLAFDRQRADITEIGEGSQIGLHADISFAERDFGSPCGAALALGGP